MAFRVLELYKEVSFQGGVEGGGRGFLTQREWESVPGEWTADKGARAESAKFGAGDVEVKKVGGRAERARRDMANLAPPLNQHG